MSGKKQIMAVGFSGYSEGITKERINTILHANEVYVDLSKISEECGKHLQMPITCT